MPQVSASELAARREALGFSQTELAARLGVHWMTVSKWERGKHRIPEMVGMALAYLEAEADPRRSLGRTATVVQSDLSPVRSEDDELDR